MFITLLVLLFSFQHEAVCNTVTIISNNTGTNFTDNKDIKLVILLKQDLRRNNDDYIDKLSNKTRFSTNDNKLTGLENAVKIKFKEFTEKLTNKTNKTIFNEEKNRRAIDVRDARGYSFIPVTNHPLIPVPSLNPIRYQTVTSQNDPIQPNYPKQDANADKAERLKQFMIKNKGLIKVFISNKRAESQTEPMPHVRPDPDPDVADLRVQGRDVRTVQRAETESDDTYSIPSPHQLDMAPARGGRVHSMRIKGRLCQRSVLLPEGPKYDSAGRVYVRAHAAARGPFAATRPPALLLPRCCNCCKKSVLGCE